ncbi:MULTISPECIES: MFS transporter [Micromonospora]|uniref:MFS transporter n=1 Tax=Micromonospora solifontis TaxID=2487138 RepID=A0ABX9W9X1_9ACTN|nr:MULTISPECIES: MFS transporter [Micromonospora]NES12552.1 MFS transporter [Micromonospora sp. PPF5-17B]NES39177.1 MFS transporter [Micromonospora solifontis]NES54563.1 MFS transporter [Micromonospora sp. PPF5-6]RNL90365.1 MFS transporter [Micromonospora solifontis]
MTGTGGGLPRRVHVGYATGSLVTGAFGTVPGLLLLPYLTDTLGVAAGVAALLVLLPKAWDVLVNPVAGRISDRTRSRWGARRPYLLGGGLALAVLFASIFAAPFGVGPAAGAYVAVAFLATATAFAFFQVPYVAMPAELTDDPAERTRLMSWRIAVLALAILVSGAVAPAVVAAGGDGLPGHRWMGLFVAALIVAGTVGAFVGTRAAPAGTVGESEPSLRAQLAVAGRNRPFRLLLICFVVQSAGVATVLAGVKYFADQVLRDPQTGPTLLFACFVGPALLVMPIWTRVGARFGKRAGLVVASLLFAAGALALVASPALPAAAVYAVVALIGVGYAGQQVFALAMLPDCIAYDTARTGRRQAGVFTGLWTAGETFGLALGPGLYGLVLQLSGYVSSATGVAADQPASARLGVLLGFTALPAPLVAVPVVLLRGYLLPPLPAAPRPLGMKAADRYEKGVTGS